LTPCAAFSVGRQRPRWLRPIRRWALTTHRIGTATDFRHGQRNNQARWPIGTRQTRLARRAAVHWTPSRRCCSLRPPTRQGRHRYDKNIKSVWIGGTWGKCSAPVARSIRIPAATAI
jgi:hypothetical protein